MKKVTTVPPACQGRVEASAQKSSEKTPALGNITKLRTATEQEALESSLFTRYDLQEVAGELMPNERVSFCRKRRISKDSPVELALDPDTGRAYYHNLIRCGSVWMCPICAAVESESRRVELNEFIKAWKLADNGVALVTLTMQHTSLEDCQTVLRSLLNSLSDFWRFREGQKIQQHYRIVGKVRSIEPLLGENGWHIHFHIVLFIEGQLHGGEVGGMQQAMMAHWGHVLERNGRYANVEHGCKVTHNDADIADYVSKLGKSDHKKWSLSHELTNSHKKRYANGSLTTWNLLERFSFGDEYLGRKWQEYARAFKGIQQLHYSKGLKVILQALLPKDSQAELPRPVPIVLAVIRIEAWRRIVELKLRGQLLAVASRGDPWQLLDLLEDFGLIIRDVYYPVLINDPAYIGRFLL